MYKRSKSILVGTNVGIDRYVEDIDGIPDLSNSTLLYMLDNETEREPYKIAKYENRIDLISEDIYGDSKYSWILMYINRIGIGDLTLGRTIYKIPQDNLTSIFRMI
nr:MAG TPA: baseplate wedge protein [Bacteriophage sp.]